MCVFLSASGPSGAEAAADAHKARQDMRDARGWGCMLVSLSHRSQLNYSVF